MNTLFKIIATIITPFEKHKQLRLIGIVFVLALVLLIPAIFSLLHNGTYLISIVNYLLVYIIATTGLNIMTGYTGQINLGGAAYFALGAYSVMILINSGLPVFVSIVIGMAICAFVGFLTAIPAAKLKYHFLALATVAIGEVVNNLIKVSPGGITNDTHGMFVKPITVFGIRLSSYESLYYFLLIMVVVILLFARAFIKSKTGRACIATRDSIEAAGSCGINFKTYKILATTVSCVMIGFAGFLFALVNKYISPDTFEAGKSTMFVSMVVIGGSGTLLGPILGSALIVIIMEVLRAIPNGSIYMQLSYALILLITLIFLPDGLSGFIQKISQKVKEARMLEQMKTNGGEKNA